MTIVGKNELAAELGWSRPKLDRYIHTHGDFPVVERGARGGGWKFDLNQVLAYFGEPPPAAGLFDEESFGLAVRALRPIGLPLTDVGVRRDGLSDEEMVIVSSFIKTLPALVNVRNFNKVIKKVQAAAACTQRQIFDYAILQMEAPAVPDPMPIEDARAFYAKAFAMTGALLDLVEFTLLKFRPTAPEDNAATLERRDEIRNFVDGLRSGIVEDLRLLYCY